MLYFVIETLSGRVERIWDDLTAALNNARARTANTGVLCHVEAREG